MMATTTSTCCQGRSKWPKIRSATSAVAVTSEITLTSIAVLMKGAGSATMSSTRWCAVLPSAASSSALE